MTAYAKATAFLVAVEDFISILASKEIDHKPSPKKLYVLRVQLLQNPSQAKTLYDKAGFNGNPTKDSIRKLNKDFQVVEVDKVATLQKQHFVQRTNHQGVTTLVPVQLKHFKLEDFHPTVLNHVIKHADTILPSVLPTTRAGIDRVLKEIADAFWNTGWHCSVPILRCMVRNYPWPRNQAPAHLTGNQVATPGRPARMPLQGPIQTPAAMVADMAQGPMALGTPDPPRPVDTPAWKPALALAGTPKTPRTISKKTLGKLTDTVLQLNAQKEAARQKRAAEDRATSQANLKLALASNERANERALAANKEALENVQAQQKMRANEDAAAGDLDYDKALEKMNLFLEYGADAEESDVGLESEEELDDGYADQVQLEVYQQAHLQRNLFDVPKQRVEELDGPGLEDAVLEADEALEEEEDASSEEGMPLLEEVEVFGNDALEEANDESKEEENGDDGSVLLAEKDESLLEVEDAEAVVYGPPNQQPGMIARALAWVTPKKKSPSPKKFLKKVVRFVSPVRQHTPPRDTPVTPPAAAALAPPVADAPTTPTFTRETPRRNPRRSSSKSNRHQT